MNYVSNMTRSGGDPKVLRTGASSLAAADKFGRALGWFSIGLGLAELLAPRRITRTLGMDGQEGLIRAYGAREIGAGIVSLSTERSLGLWGRVAGDALDIATVMPALGRENRKRNNAALVMALLIGVALVDIVAAQAVTTRHQRRSGERRFYGNRSGFPKGLETVRGAAKDFATPTDMRHQFGPGSHERLSVDRNRPQSEIESRIERTQAAYGETPLEQQPSIP